MPKEKIIIVDDENDIIDLCSRVLTFEGYEVKTAHNGFEAIDIARSEYFDLLLTDIKMPGMTGLDIARTLKKTDPNMICVAMTGYGTIDMVIEALKLGIDEFITKPFTPKELSQSVSKALEKVRLRKENYRLHSLIPLFELNKILMATVEEKEIFQQLLEISQKETRASLAAIYSKRHKLQLFYPPEETTAPALQQAYNQLAEMTQEQNGQISANLKNQDQKHQQLHSLLAEIKMNAVLSTPLKSKNKTIGTLILARQDGEFAPSDSEFLAVLTGQAAVALENARLFTEIQNAYTELQKLDHMKSEFINIAAHELRTPLAILMGYVTVLEDDFTEGEQREYLDNIMRNAMRLRSLIDDMLNLKHLESGEITLTSIDTDLSKVIADIQDDMNLMIRDKQLSIQIDIPEDFPLLIVDRTKLDLVLMNLFHNAIKFTPDNGTILFTAAVEGDEAVIDISDTGVGIPTAELEKIFDRFYQVEQSLTREFGGIGLGLAIVKGMTHVCGGKISVKSKKENGTTFTLRLPLDNRHLGKRILVL